MSSFPGFDFFFFFYKIYTGEISCIPLPHAIASIWPLPFGLLLQRATDGNCPPHLSFPSSSSLLNARDLSRPNRESGPNPQCNANMLNALGHNFMVDVSATSSHLILKHPLEEPHVCFAFLSFSRFCYFFPALFFFYIILCYSIHLPYALYYPMRLILCSFIFDTFYDFVEYFRSMPIVYMHELMLKLNLCAFVIFSYFGPDHICCFSYFVLQV